MSLLIILAGIVGLFAISLWIWLSSRGIARASEMWGSGWSPGVRGATIHAIASSVPELFTATVFLVILGDLNGFVSGISTVAGSAIFNALIIPSLMAFTVFLKLGKSLQPHNKNVLIRDGIWLLIVQAVILLMVLSGELTTLYGLFLLLFYALYIFSLSRVNNKTKTPRRKFSTSIKRKLYLTFVFSLLGLGLGCYFLVEGCLYYAEELQIDLPVIALLIAAAATSLPDTFLSVGDAIKGNSSDAISNAFGSNIFDLCVAMGLPLTIYSLFAGSIHISTEIIHTFTLLWIALVALTILAIAIMYFAKSLNWKHATALMLSYILFVVAVILDYFPLVPEA